MTRTPDTAPARPAAPARVYRKDLLVRFADCDPAGIVFYPRYLEIFNNLVEDWCSEELKFSFSEIITRRGWGLPTVHLEVDFTAPSVFGETLSATLSLRSLGTSSIWLDISLYGPDGAARVLASVVLVLIDRRTSCAIPIPEDLRACIARFQTTR